MIAPAGVRTYSNVDWDRLARSRVARPDIARTTCANPDCGRPLTGISSRFCPECLGIARLAVDNRITRQEAVFCLAGI